MLNSLRTFVGSWAAKILLILLVGSFALWGISGSVLSQGDLNTVATIGSTKVPVRNFLSAYNRNIGPIQQQAARRLTREEARAIGIEQRSLNDVIAFGTLDEYARRAGLALSEKTLEREIGSTPAFQDSAGNFSRDAFTRAVFNAQMRESDFIKLQNSASIRAQLTTGFADGPVLPDTFANAAARFVNEARQFEYVTVSSQNIPAISPPGDAALDTYFEANKQAYAAPEYRKLAVLEISPELIADESAISDEDVAADYETRKSSYETPETRRVEQVVFVSQEAANDVLAKIEDGQLFNAAVTQAGLAVGQLGSVTKSSLPKEVGDAAFALNLNEVSGVVDGPFGPALLRVIEIKNASTKLLTQVSAEIRTDLALRAAADRINDLYEAIEDARAGGRRLADIGAEYDFNVRIINAVDRQARNKAETVITDIPASQELLQRAFNSQVGQAGSAIESDNNDYVWFDVLEIEEARSRTLNEVRAQVVANWQENQRAEAIAAKALALEKKLAAGESLAELAELEGLNVQKTGAMKRTDQTDAFPRPAVIAGFAGGEEHVFTHQLEGDSGKILAKVVDVSQTGEALAEDQLEQLNATAADDLLSQLIVRLQSEYDVTLNQQSIDLALTQGR